MSVPCLSTPGSSAAFLADATLSIIGAERLQFDFENARGFPFEVDSKSQVATRFGYGMDLDVLGGSFRMEAVHRRYTADEVRIPGDSVEIFEPLENINFAFVAGLRIGVR